MAQPQRVLFVCLGNICRSPLAEGVFRQLCERHGAPVEVESAGTGAYHVGEAPDRRMRQTARRHGVDIEHLRARQAVAADFDRFDLILAMDRNNLQNLKAIAPTNARATLKLFRDFDPTPGDGDVPDPYYGSGDGFEHVYTIVERTSQALLRQLS